MHGAVLCKPSCLEPSSVACMEQCSACTLAVLAAGFDIVNVDSVMLLSGQQFSELASARVTTLTMSQFWASGYIDFA